MKGDDYFKILKVYNCKSSSLSPDEFCGVLGIQRWNTKAYTKVLSLIKEAVEVKDGFSNKKIIEINRRKLARLIRMSDWFKLNAEFVKTDTPFSHDLG